MGENKLTKEQEEMIEAEAETQQSYRGRVRTDKDYYYGYTAAATTYLLRSVEDKKEIERLKGLIEKRYKADLTEYFGDEKIIEHHWQQLKAEKNL